MARFVHDIELMELKNERLLGTKWEPRTKTVTCFLFCFGIVSLKTTLFLAITFVLLFVVLLSIGFSFKNIMTKLLLIAPFLAVMTLPILFANGLSIAPERMEFALNLVLKAACALLVMILMLLSQPVQTFLTGLAHLRLPPMLISVLFLSFHYTFLFMRRLKVTYKALTARFFKRSAKVSSLKVYGELIGGMLVQSMEQADKVHKAMVARGFTGEMPTTSLGKIPVQDYVKSLFFLCYIASLIAIEKW